MRHRLFGPAGLRVSELFLGAMTFGEQGGVGAPPEETARITDTCAEAGGNVVDTAVSYRGEQSEEIPGHLLAGRRARFALSTKYTVTRDRVDPNAAGNHRKNLRQSRSHLGSRREWTGPVLCVAVITHVRAGAFRVISFPAAYLGLSSMFPPSQPAALLALLPLDYAAGSA